MAMVGCTWTAFTLNQWEASEGPEKSQAEFVHLKAGSHHIPTQHIPGPSPVHSNTHLLTAHKLVPIFIFVYTVL